MILGEQLELALYRFVELLGKGQTRPLDLTTVTDLVKTAQSVDAVDALIRLHDDGYISLIKYDAGPTPQSFESMNRDRDRFFYRGMFNVTVTPKGRLDFEKREVAVATAQDKLPKPKKPARRTFRTGLNKYEVHDQIGGGGNGLVLKVLDDDGTAYALKVMHANSLGGRKAKRFRHELFFCLRSDHQNIVQVLDYGVSEENGCPFFVMPLFDTTLRKAMKRGLPPERIPSIVEQLVNALEFAHGRDIYHRDIKPENILCNSDLSHVVLADCGIAHFSEDQLLTTVETREDDRVASFAYAAPEQRMVGAEVGPPADIWALGMIINELFTGLLPLGMGYEVIGSKSPQHAYIDSLVVQMLNQSPSKRPSIGQLKPHFVAVSKPHSDVHLSRAEDGLPSMKEDVLLSSPADVWVHVMGHPSEKGLILQLTNRTTHNIEECKVALRSAQSYDRTAQSFRDDFGFKSRRLITQQHFLAGDMTAAAWLVRVKDDHLEIGDTQGEGSLFWPRGDQSELQAWKLHLRLAVSGVTTITLVIVVAWDRFTGKMLVGQSLEGFDLESDGNQNITN